MQVEPRKKFKQACQRKTSTARFPWTYCADSARVGCSSRSFRLDGTNIIRPALRTSFMISIRDLRVDYDNLCAVQDLTLTVDDGEVCGLIGPNGAGKTTTMRTMLGLIEPTYGQIEIMGIDVHEHPHEVARMVGFMPDFPPVYEDLLVWEFLDLFAASYRIPRWNRPEAGRSPPRDGWARRETQCADYRAVARDAAAADAGQDVDTRPLGALARRAGQRR